MERDHIFAVGKAGSSPVSRVWRVMCLKVELALRLGEKRMLDSQLKRKSAAPLILKFFLLYVKEEVKLDSKAPGGRIIHHIRTLSNSIKPRAPTP